MKIEIDLTKTILGDQYWNEFCDFFSVPEKERYYPHTVESMRERIRTYLNAYVLRRSITERENGAAFKTPEPAILPDPSVDNAEKKE